MFSIPRKLFQSVNQPDNIIRRNGLTSLRKNAKQDFHNQPVIVRKPLEPLKVGRLEDDCV
jgi:hypothetical protein